MGLISNLKKRVSGLFKRGSVNNVAMNVVKTEYFRFSPRYVNLGKGNGFKIRYNIYHITKFSDKRPNHKYKIYTNKSLGFILATYGFHADKIPQTTIIKQRRSWSYQHFTK